MSWLDNYSTTNTFRSMYINGFMDISGGRLQTRSVTDGHLLIAGDSSLNNLEVHGDVSLNGNLYVGGDISWNPNSLANDSIPSSAIIGGAVGATGPAGPVGSNTEVMLLTSTGTNNTTAALLYNLQWDIHGSVNMLADPQAIRSYGTGSQVYNSNHTVSALSMLFNAGVYKVTISGRRGETTDEFALAFDLDNDNLIGYMNGNEEFQSHRLGAGWDVVSQTYTFVVPHVANFHWVERNSNHWYDYNATRVQILFERTGIPPFSGTDDTLHCYGNIPIITQRSITGGLYWSSTVTKPTDSNEYIDISESGSEWIYRIDPNTTSSVEVASFHSDADLSLNKRLFVGEDVSLNGNLYVGGDISWNPTSLANNSIPSSAVVREVMLFDAVTQGTDINTSSSMYDLEWKIYGSVNFFADTSAKRCLLYHTTLNRHYHCISINLKPGIYKVTMTAKITEHLNWGFDNDHSGKFLWPNGSGSEDGDWNGPDPTIVITTPVLSNTNFHLCVRHNGTVRATNNYDAQVLFERIGTVPNSSGQTDQALADIGSNNSGSSFASQDETTIQGGLQWSTTLTKPTDPDEYLDLNDSGTEWIYRIS